MSIRAGQRYRAVHDLEVIAMTHWNAPFTGGHEGVLPAGEIFTIAIDPPESATAAYCDPARYDELHARFVPPEDREHPKYSGYSLSITLSDIRERAEFLTE